MVIRRRDLASLIEGLAPVALAEGRDNVGFQVGDADAPLGRVCVGLTPDADTVEAAIALGGDMLVVHHPLILAPLRNLVLGVAGTATSRTVARCVSAGLAVYSAHTNLDAAVGGVSDALAMALDLGPVRIDSSAGSPVPVRPHAGGASGVGYGRFVDLQSPVPAMALAEHVSRVLAEPCVRLVGDPRALVHTVALCGGSGSDMIPELAGRADIYITGDVRYHAALEATDLGIALVDAGHFATEWPVVPYLAARMRQ